MKSFCTISLFALGALSWELDYYAGSQCRGGSLGGMQNDHGPSVCTDFDAINVDSVEVIAKGNTDTSLEFYSGKGCTGDMLALQSNGGCVPLNLGDFASVGTV